MRRRPAWYNRTRKSIFVLIRLPNEHAPSVTRPDSAVKSGEEPANGKMLIYILLSSIITKRVERADAVIDGAVARREDVLY